MGWNPFAAKTFLDREDEEWQMETWQWFQDKLAGKPFSGTPLVLPTQAFFPPTEKDGHERALHIFSCVKQLAGMSEWECELVPQPHRPELRVSDVVALKPIKSGPAGSIRMSGSGVSISYDPSDVKEPVALIATFAHELAHYRLGALAHYVPGGQDLHEFATDLLTVYMGFGYFGLSSAFNFRQHQDAMSQGWQWTRRGYLSEREWAFAVAIFLRATERRPADLKPYLKRHLYSDLMGAVRRLERAGAPRSA